MKEIEDNEPKMPVIPEASWERDWRECEEEHLERPRPRQEEEPSKENWQQP